MASSCSNVKAARCFNAGWRGGMDLSPAGTNSSVTIRSALALNPLSEVDLPPRRQVRIGNNDQFCAILSAVLSAICFAPRCLGGRPLGSLRSSSSNPAAHRRGETIAGIGFPMVGPRLSPHSTTVSADVTLIVIKSPRRASRTPCLRNESQAKAAPLPRAGSGNA